MKSDERTVADPFKPVGAGVEAGRLAVGDTVDDLVIEEVGTGGGFASIYRVRHVPSGESRALKVLWPEIAASTRLSKRFEHEAKALATLHHPNIVRVIDFGALPDGRPYYTMEWLEGRTLSQVLREEGPFAPAEAVALLHGIGGAVAAAHDAGIVHRDLKTANVMMVPSESWFTPKLVDFGIAKLLEPEKVGVDDIVTTSTTLGTPFYMAPEQILGHAVDQRTDIYALGLLLYEIVTGEVPFKAETRVEIEEMHLHAVPPRASEVAPVPVGFDAIIARCLEKEPAGRYPTVREVLDDLQRALTSPIRIEHTRMGVGVLVQARIDPDLEDISDAEFDDVETIVAAARRALEAVGMHIEEQGSIVLGVAVLPDEDGDRIALRSRVVRSAVALENELARRPGKNAHVDVAIAVHAASVVVKPGEGLPGTGDLLKVGGWIPDGAGVFATEAAARDVDGIVAESMPGTALYQIRLA